MRKGIPLSMTARFRNILTAVDVSIPRCSNTRAASSFKESSTLTCNSEVDMLTSSSSLVVRQLYCIVVHIASIFCCASEYRTKPYSDSISSLVRNTVYVYKILFYSWEGRGRVRRDSLQLTHHSASQLKLSLLTHPSFQTLGIFQKLVRRLLPPKGAKRAGGAPKETIEAK